MLDSCLKFWKGCDDLGIEGRRTKVWRDKTLFNTEKRLEKEQFMESWYESWGETLPEAAERWEELCQELEGRIEELQQDPPAKRPNDGWIFTYDYPEAGAHDAAHPYEVDEAMEALASLKAQIENTKASEMEPALLQYQNENDSPWFPLVNYDTDVDFDADG